MPTVIVCVQIHKISWTETIFRPAVIVYEDPMFILDAATWVYQINETNWKRVNQSKENFGVAVVENSRNLADSNENSASNARKS